MWGGLLLCRLCYCLSKHYVYTNTPNVQMQYSSRKYISMHCTVCPCSTYFWSSYRETLSFSVKCHVGKKKRNTTKIVQPTKSNKKTKTKPEQQKSFWNNVVKKLNIKANKEKNKRKVKIIWIIWKALNGRWSCIKINCDSLVNI